MEVKKIQIKGFESWKGVVQDVELTYQVSGPALGDAPIVVVCHALTGNSSVAGPDGWWGNLIGEAQMIDTRRYSVLCFDIPGNRGEGGAEYDRFSLRDVARLFLSGLQVLGVTSVYAIIGASMGGALVWQMAALAPDLARYVFPIASDYKASDWLLAQTEVQRILLATSSTPIHDARIHAMLCYRTPESLCARFGGRCVESSGVPQIVDWLDYHGKTLEERFSLSAYQTMTFLTSDIHVADNVSGLVHISGEIHLVSIDSDLLFPHFTAIQTVADFRSLGRKVSLHTIRSIHGHDAFLMEYHQLNSILRPFFIHH